jgi:hypothetical protein
MKRHAKSTKSVWKIDPCDCRQVDIARLFNVTAQAVAAWPCPRLENGNYSIDAVIEWRISSLKPESTQRVELENQRLTLICEKMTIDIERMKAETISLETHKQIFSSRAMSLKNFFFQVFDKNAHLLCHKSIDQIRPQVTELLTVALNHYSSQHK